MGKKVNRKKLLKHRLKKEKNLKQIKEVAKEIEVPKKVEKQQVSGNLGAGNKKARKRAKQLRHKLKQEAKIQKKISDTPSLDLENKSTEKEKAVQNRAASGNAKNRKRAKQLRHKLKQEARKQKLATPSAKTSSSSSNLVQNFASGLKTTKAPLPKVKATSTVKTSTSRGTTRESDFEDYVSKLPLDFYREQLRAAEEEYSTEVDKYIKREVSRRIVEKKAEVVDNYQTKPLVWVDYVKELQRLGLDVEPGDVRVVPDLGRMRLFVEDWKDEYRLIREANNKGYGEIMDQKFSEEDAMEEATRWFIKYQDDLVNFRRFAEHLNGVMYNAIIEYRREVEAIVF